MGHQHIIFKRLVHFGFRRPSGWRQNHRNDSVWFYLIQQTILLNAVFVIDFFIFIFTLRYYIVTFCYIFIFYNASVFHYCRLPVQFTWLVTIWACSFTWDQSSFRMSAFGLLEWLCLFISFITTLIAFFTSLIVRGVRMLPHKILIWRRQVEKGLKYSRPIYFT